MSEITDLLRDDLRGRSPYGAPQIEVPVRLNTNENSYPVPPEVVSDIVAAVERVAGDLNRYPDREFTELREELARYLSRSGSDVAADAIWAGNGSNEVLLHLLQAFGGPGRTALGFTPAYSMHPIISAATGTRWVDGHRTSSGSAGPTGFAHFELSADSAADQVRRHAPDIVFICTPNNPTGTAVGLDVIERVHDAAPRAIIIVDEAYAEFARAGTQSALTLLPGRPRLVVTRTMSKAFALAGGRLGYLAADPEVTDALRLVRMPYHLSAPTQAIAIAVLRHAEAMLATVGVIREQRDRLVTELADLGLDPVPSDANFVLYGGLDEAVETWRALLDHGVLVRDVGIEHYLRVTAGTPRECTAFLEAMAALAPDHVRTQRA